jgi:hypothetical protein
LTKALGTLLMLGIAVLAYYGSWRLLKFGWHLVVGR